MRYRLRTLLIVGWFSALLLYSLVRAPAWVGQSQDWMGWSSDPWVIKPRDEMERGFIAGPPLDAEP